MHYSNLKSKKIQRMKIAKRYYSKRETSQLFLNSFTPNLKPASCSSSKRAKVYFSEIKLNQKLGLGPQYRLKLYVESENWTKHLQNIQSILQEARILKRS